jgi:PAS domain S-box-containing protein
MSTNRHIPLMLKNSEGKTVIADPYNVRKLLFRLAFSVFFTVFLIGAKIGQCHTNDLNPDRLIIAKGSDTYAPYSFLNKEGRVDGFNNELFQAVAKAAELKVRIELSPWSEVRNELEFGKIDVITGMYYSKERDNLVDISLPHNIIKYSIFVRKNSRIKSLADLNGKEIIVMRGAISHDFFKYKGIAGKAVLAEDASTALHLLSSGKHDCAFLVRLQGFYFLKKFKIKNVKAVGEPFSPVKFCFAIREDDSILLARLNEGLFTVKETGEFDEIFNKWFGVLERDTVPLQQTLRHAAFILIPFIGLLLVFFFWSWSLKRQVKSKTERIISELSMRKRAEEALWKSEKESSIRSQVAEIFIKVPDDKMYFEVLQIVMEAMESPYGTFAYINEHGDRVVPVLTRDIWVDCEVQDVDLVFPRERWSGIWGKCLINKETVSSSGPFRVPEGHVPITRAVAVPIIHQGETIGNFMVANKTTDYGETDKELLESIAGHLAPVLHARLQRDRQEEERKRAEMALREERSFAEGIIDTAQVIILVLDVKGRIVRFNSYMEEISGYSLDEVQGKDWFTTFLSAKDHKRIRDLFQKAAGDIQTRGSVNPIVTKDGSERQIEWYDKALKDADKNVTGLLAIGMDVTERKRAEMALRDSEDRYRALFEYNPVDTIFVDNEAKIMMYSLAKKKSGGRLPNIGDVMYKDYAENHKVNMFEQLMECIKSGEQKEFVELKYNERFLNIRISSFSGGAIITSIDTTVRRLAEEALRESEEKYRTFLETTSEGCWLINPELKTVEVNATLCKMLGYSQDEMLGKTPFDFVDDENRKIFIEQTSRISTTLHRSYEITLQKKNGEDLQTYFNATTIKNESGEVQGSFAFIADITERKQTEEAIRLLKEKYEDLYSNAPIMYLSNDTNGTIIECNNTVLDKLGYTKREIIGKHMTKFMTKESADSFKKDFPKLLKTGKILGVERQLVAKDREIIDVIIDVTVEYDEHGKPIKTRGTFKDITERKLVENAMREREQIMKAILSASPVGIALVRNRILDWTNSAMNRIWGYEEGSLLGKSTEVLYPDVEEYERVGRKFYTELEENGVAYLETRWVTKDGRGIQCYLQGCPLDPSDISKGVIVATMDITKLKQADEQIQTLSQQLIHAQERERQMISYELHDSIAQNLSTLKIGCDMLCKDQSVKSSELKERIAELSNLTEQTIIAVRDLSYDLRPPGLDEMGLVAEIEIYCKEFSEKTGLEIDFQSAGVRKLIFDSNSEIHFYRLVQEGLNNICKHAHATRATIKMVGAFPNIILRIEDDGKGFDVKARELALDKEKRLGLRSMKERVNLLQGQMTIHSRLMEGTKIFIKLPYLEQDNESKEKHINY